ncbi:MAG: 2-C-methyl-D-erythritol 4-phosphate cytidylyltransferase [Prevotella sp.]|nr:2-C-methyl-D-erythritol 4-phosphate cytidylyltransferase [Prevotella sp.]
MDYVIIVAGGKGLRMGGDVPKQFLLLGDRPVLMHTLQRFADDCKDLQIILVLPQEQIEYWSDLGEKYHFGVEHWIVAGGETRFHSVQSGLAQIPDDAEGVVAVHDGVRPLVSREVIGKCFEEARRKKAVVPVVPVVESLRHVSDGAVPRADYRLVQTPQTFDIQLLKQAYRLPFSKDFTDDASVVEAFGHPITMVEGNRENIKLTTPFDLKIAEAIINGHLNCK